MSMLRISVPGQPVRLIREDEPKLTKRQAHILHVVRAHRGNRSHAAKELGVNTSTVQMSLLQSAKAGARIPPPATRKGIKNSVSYLGPRCNKVMTFGGICGRKVDHRNHCIEGIFWQRKRNR